MSKIVLVILVIFSPVISNKNYVPPRAQILPLHPAGIKMSIPDEKGISLVAYHVKINKKFIALEAGSIARDIIQPTDGKWTYEDHETQLKKGDVIYYWIHVVYNELGYNSLNQAHIVSTFYDYEGHPIKKLDSKDSNSNMEDSNMEDTNADIPLQTEKCGKRCIQIIIKY